MKTNYLGAILIALAALGGLSSPSFAATKSAIFAGGCFWCVEKDFDHVPGVTATTSGYSGGTSANPTYEDYVDGGHREVVKVDYDDTKIDYAKLLDVFWHSVDPTDDGGQFCDRGHAYTTAIYTSDPAEVKLAEASKATTGQALGKPIATEIAAAAAFWPAEDYHQKYYEKNPVRYRYYRSACGRDDRIEELWGKAAHQGIEGY